MKNNFDAELTDTVNQLTAELLMSYISYYSYYFINRPIYLIDCAQRAQTSAKAPNRNQKLSGIRIRTDKRTWAHKLRLGAGNYTVYIRILVGKDQ